MRLADLTIRNFRCITQARIPFSETTVIIGENNSGKSSLLDAVRIVLSHRWGRRGTGFEETDFTMDEARPHPSMSDPISILARFSELTPSEWPNSVVTALSDIIQQDVTMGTYAVLVRAACSYNAISKEIDPGWDFLSLDGTPLNPKRGRATNLTDFFTYVPSFNLSALRDASREFSPRSRFWGALLKAVQVKDAKKIEDALKEINEALVASSDKLEDIRAALKAISGVIQRNAVHQIEIRGVPLTTWDLLDKAEVFVQARAGDPFLPIERQGSGVQSLAVIYLLQAFIEHALGTQYSKEAEPIILLEEPEAHLHPQAARALWQELVKLRGQKIVTTHSPHFLQDVPLRNVRLMRRTTDGIAVHYLPEDFEEEVPQSGQLLDFISKRPDRFRYDAVRKMLRVRGALSEDDYRKLCACFPDPAQRMKAIEALKKLKDASGCFVSDAELEALQTDVRRLRGEIFFARSWLLCEGQSEYYLLPTFADLAGFPLDPNGISLIDYQNHGSPRLFASLARAFGTPWTMLCDGDEAGKSHIEQLKSVGFSNQEIGARVVQLASEDLELEICNSTLQPLAMDVGRKFFKATGRENADDLAKLLRQDKVRSAIEIARLLRRSMTPVASFPAAIARFLEITKSAIR